MEMPYNYKGCQSLFGYAQRVHERSGGVCQLCNCGAGPVVDFHLWRQMTVEHLLGRKQGGYLPELRAAVASRFPGMSLNERERIIERIDMTNTVTACSFCNSVTSRMEAALSLPSLIADTPGDPADVLAAVTAALENVLAAKKARAARVLASVQTAFEEQVAPKLNAVRRQTDARPRP